MTKNLVSRKHTRQLSPEERKRIFLDRFSIKEQELENIIHLANNKKRKAIKEYYTDLASILFLKSITLGYNKEFALAQITTGNLALPSGKYEDINMNERAALGEISRAFRQDREKEENRLAEMGYNIKLNNIHMVRKAAFEKATGKTLEANVEETAKAWGNNIRFSKNDLLSGTNIPQKLTTTMTFLLGIYHVDGKLQGNNLSLSGERQDMKTTEKGAGLYEKVVYPAMNTLFKLGGCTDFKKGRIRIESEAHSGWLREIGFGNQDFPNWKSHVKRKNRLSKESDIQLYDRAFFFGMLAGAATTPAKTARYPLLMQNSRYAEQFAELAQRFGYQINHDHLRGRVYINKEGIEKIMKERFELKANGLEFEHIGGFYNPSHIRFLSERYIKEFYLEMKDR